MTAGDPWGAMSQLVVAALLTAPWRAREVDPKIVAGGPARALVEALRARLDAGRPVDVAALFATGDDELTRMGGREWLLDRVGDDAPASKLEEYLAEACRLAAGDLVQRAVTNGGLSQDVLDRAQALLKTSVASSAVDLGFVDADEYAAGADLDIAWVWRGFLAQGSATMLSAPPKRGKSTLIAALVGAITKGSSSFLARAVSPGPVIWVSEESSTSLEPKVTGRREHRLRILDRRAAFPRRPWPEIVAAIAQEARELGAVLVIVDTVRFWAGMRQDQEKDAGAVQAVVEPLLELASGGPAVLFTHHDRKAGGEDGDAASGSTAWGATVDCVIDMPRRSDGEAPSGKRTLLALSRWAEETPAALVFDRRGDGSLAALAEGDRGHVGRRTLHQRIIAAFGDAEATASDIADALEVTPQRIGSALKEMVRESLLEVTQEAAGRRPRLYRLVERALPKSPVSTSAPGAVSLLSPPPKGETTTDTPDSSTDPVVDDGVSTTSPDGAGAGGHSETRSEPMSASPDEPAAQQTSWEERLTAYGEELEARKTGGREEDSQP